MHTFSARLAGVNFRPKEAKDLLAYLFEGSEFTLVREPDNEWDMNAIKVFAYHPLTAERYHVGYISRLDNTVIADLMDRGTKFKAILVARDERPKKLDHYIRVEEIPATLDERRTYNGKSTD